MVTVKSLLYWKENVKTYAVKAGMCTMDLYPGFHLR